MTCCFFISHHHFKRNHLYFPAFCLASLFQTLCRMRTALIWNPNPRVSRAQSILKILGNVLQKNMMDWTLISSTLPRTTITRPTPRTSSQAHLFPDAAKTGKTSSPARLFLTSIEPIHSLTFFFKHPSAKG